MLCVEAFNGGSSREVVGGAWKDVQGTVVEDAELQAGTGIQGPYTVIDVGIVNSMSGLS